MDNTTLDQLREAANQKRDAVGAPLPDEDVAYYLRMLDGVSESETGHWLWSGRIRGGSPEMKWPGYPWGAMVRRKVWRLLIGTEPGGGELSLARVCDDKRCIRPHREHVTLSGYRKGGANTTTAKTWVEPRRGLDANEVAKLTDTLRASAIRLRELGVRVELAIG